jgi:hypothetical protein
MKNPRHIRSRQSRSAGFTMTEVLIAAFISTIAVGAAISLSISAVKTFYVDSDYLEIGARQRRLSDDLIEKVSRANDLQVFYDISDLTRAADTDRGDCLVVLRRDMGTLNGPIAELHCYYLARIPVTATGSGPVGLWYFSATPPGSLVTDPVIALNTYTRSGLRQLSGEMFRASLPRPAPAPVAPPASFVPREGIFTMSNPFNDIPPSVQITMPTRLKPANHQQAQSSFNFAVSLRR